jgi:hypothetical protein
MNSWYNYPNLAELLEIQYLIDCAATLKLIVKNVNPKAKYTKVKNDKVIK